MTQHRRLDPSVPPPACFAGHPDSLVAAAVLALLAVPTAAGVGLRAHLPWPALVLLVAAAPSGVVLLWGLLQAARGGRRRGVTRRPEAPTGPGRPAGSRLPGARGGRAVPGGPGAPAPGPSVGPAVPVSGGGSAKGYRVARHPSVSSPADVLQRGRAGRVGRQQRGPSRRG